MNNVSYILNEYRTFIRRNSTIRNNSGNSVTVHGTPFLNLGDEISWDERKSRKVVWKCCAAICQIKNMISIEIGNFASLMQLDRFIPNIS